MSLVDRLNNAIDELRRAYSSGAELHRVRDNQQIFYFTRHSPEGANNLFLERNKSRERELTAYREALPVMRRAAFSLGKNVSAAGLKKR